MSAKPLNPKGLALVIETTPDKAHRKSNPVHISRKLLTRPGQVSNALCGHKYQHRYIFDFFWFMYDHAPICPRCRSRAEARGLSNGT